VSQVRSVLAGGALHNVAGLVGTPTQSAVRLTVPPANRQRAPMTTSSPQVLKVVGTQPGSVPQIITLSSARAQQGVRLGGVIVLIRFNKGVVSCKFKSNRNLVISPCVRCVLTKQYNFFILFCEYAISINI